MGNLYRKTDCNLWNKRKTIKKFILHKNVFIAGFMILILSLLILYIINHLKEFENFFIICSGNILAVFFSTLLFVALIGINGFQFNYLTKIFQLDLPVKEWFGLAMINNFYNLVTPFRGGFIVKAVYLKKKYDFAYTNFVSVQGAFQIFVLLTAGITGFIGILCIGGGYSSHKILLLSFLGIMVLLISILLGFSSKFKFKTETEHISKWYSRLIKIVKGWQILKQEKDKLLVITGITLLQRILKACFLILIYYCFDFKLGFWGALFISSITMFSKVIHILPGNLGLDDIVTIFSASYIGVPLEAAIAAALLARMVNFTVCLTLGPLFSYLLIKKN